LKISKQVSQKNITIIFAVAILLSVQNIAKAEYSLAPGPFSVEEVGQTVESATNEMGSYPYPIANGENHDISYWWTGNLSMPIQILDINLNTGISRVVDAPASGRPSYAAITHSNQKAYEVGGSDYMFEYNPESGLTKSIGKLSDNNGGQTMIEGDNHLIYIGQCCHGNIDWYDPATDQKGNFGSINDYHPETYYRYAYFLGADPNYVYASVRDQYQGWSLTAIQMDASGKIKLAEKNLWANLPMLTTSGENVFLPIKKGLDGSWYVHSSYGSNYPSPEVGEWYKLDGFNDPVLQGSAPSLWPSPAYPVTWINQLPGLVDSGTNGLASASWTIGGQNRSSTAQFKMAPYPIQRIFASSSDATKILGWAAPYGGVFSYDIQNDKTNYLNTGMRQTGSYYDALFSGNFWYLSGYTGVFQSFDWGKVYIGYSQWRAENNPVPLPIDLDSQAHYLYRMAEGANGEIFLGGQWERTDTGSSLGWYNIQTKARGAEKAAFHDYNLADLVAIEGGKRIVFSGGSYVSGVQNALIVFDAATKTVERTIPLGTREAGKLMEGTNGTLIMINKQNPASVYKIDVNSGQILAESQISGVPFGGRRYCYDALVKGPDGFGWLYVDDDLSRINPETLEVQKIIENAGSAGNPVFIKNNQNNFDVYLDGGSPLAGAVNRIRKIENVLLFQETISSADINQDSSVNVTDLGILMSDFGKSAEEAGNPRSDINSDGAVNVMDLGILMSEWK
jgi:hypothetical protein